VAESYLWICAASSESGWGGLRVDEAPT